MNSGSQCLRAGIHIRFPLTRAGKTKGQRAAQGANTKTPVGIEGVFVFAPCAGYVT